MCPRGAQGGHLPDKTAVAAGKARASDALGQKVLTWCLGDEMKQGLYCWSWWKKRVKRRPRKNWVQVLSVAAASNPK